MGRQYESAIEITDKKLIERIKACLFRDLSCKMTEEEWKQNSNHLNHYIDLAKFFGIRETLEHTPEDVELNEEEVEKMMELAGWGKCCRGAYAYLYNWKEDTQSATFVVSGWNDCPDGVLEYISKMYPDKEFEVTQSWETWEDDDPGYDECILLNGRWFHDHQAVEDDKLFEKGMAIAEAGNYEEAIVVLKPLVEKEDDNTLCNVGVCYERLGNYEKASELYKKSSAFTAKENLLKLYDHNHIKFDLNNYKETCEELIKRHRQEGYLYMSYLHQDKEKGEYDEKQAFIDVTEGLTNCNKVDNLLFEYAYLCEKGIGTEVDNEKSHSFYKMLLDHPEWFMAKYNYALQSMQGRGCKKNIKEAIKLFTICADKFSYEEAVDRLIEIYSMDEYRDAKKVKYWKSKKGKNK